MRSLLQPFGHAPWTTPPCRMSNFLQPPAPLHPSTGMQILSGRGQTPYPSYDCSICIRSTLNNCFTPQPNACEDARDPRGMQCMRDRAYICSHRCSPPHLHTCGRGQSSVHTGTQDCIPATLSCRLIILGPCLAKLCLSACEVRRMIWFHEKTKPPAASLVTLRMRDILTGGGTSMAQLPSG